MHPVIEKDAALFARHFPQNAISIKIAKDELEKKLENLKLDKHKLYFLNTLRNSVRIKGEEHKTKCNNPACKQDRNFEIALFTIDQEIESLSNCYTPQLPPENQFTIEERVELHTKINEILQKLEEIGIGQQVVFEEIDSLKERFDLGKKDWAQLLKGKLVDLGTQNLLEKGVIPMIYQTIIGSNNAGFFTLPQ